MEKGALLGMMSLAGSDLLFCVVTISGTYLPDTKMIYTEQDFSYYYTLYGNCIQNTLIKTSTWFTVIMAVCRYFVVTQPIRARQYMRCCHTAIATVLCLIIWVALHVPLAFMWKTFTVSCPKGNIYLLDFGRFKDDKTMMLSFTYLWAILGFFIPVLILGYCNVNLIYSLHVSSQVRLQEVESSSVRRVSQKHSLLQSKDSSMSCRHTTDKAQRGITCTLVAIVIMFFVCIFPSEIIHLYEDIQKPDYFSASKYVMVSANLLQAVNFSANFALYCVVNGYFRKTIKLWLLWCCSKERRLVRNLSRISSGSVTTKQVTINCEQELA